MTGLKSLCFEGPAVGRLRMLGDHQDLMHNNIDFKPSRNKGIFQSPGAHSLKGHLYFANRKVVPQNLAANKKNP